MEWLGSLSEILKYIKNLGYGAALGSGTLGVVYIAFCLITSSIPNISYLEGVLVIGALLGYGVQGILVLSNRSNNRLKDARTEMQIVQEKSDLIARNAELGRISPSQASKLTEQAFSELFLPERETESIDVLEPREQRQITQGQEEE